jgi:hypothetical protein
MEAAVRRHRAMLAAVGALAVVAGAPPTSGPLLKAVVWMLAILAVVVPVAVHATAASPKSAARPLDLHLVVTMLGAWAAWMAAVAPSSADATTARNVSCSMLVASPSGYPAGWPSR